MFRLSQKADYGLILLSDLAKSKSLTSVSKIANKNQISPKFLSQIAHDLKEAGILTSKEGVLGGYTLAKSARDIKLLDVLKILEGELLEGNEAPNGGNHGRKNGGRSRSHKIKKWTLGKKIPLGKE